MNKGRDGGGVAVVEAYGNGKDFVGGGSGEGNAEVGAGWVCSDKRCSEEGREGEEGGGGERLPDGKNGIEGRHSDCSRMGFDCR